MPLYGQIERDGQLIPLRWGWWHIEVMSDAAEKCGHDLWEEGEVTLTDDLTYTDDSDGEVLPLKRGDVLRLFRG